jgi:hypothetical protein
MQKTTIPLLLFSIFIFLPTDAGSAGDAGFGGKIAFLRSGESWVADQAGGNIKRQRTPV